MRKHGGRERGGRVKCVRQHTGVRLTILLQALEYETVQSAVTRISDVSGYLRDSISDIASQSKTLIEKEKRERGWMDEDVKKEGSFLSIQSFLADQPSHRLPSTLAFPSSCPVSSQERQRRRVDVAEGYLCLFFSLSSFLSLFFAPSFSPLSLPLDLFSSAEKAICKQ